MRQRRAARANAAGWRANPADASQMPDVPAWRRWQWPRVWLFCPRRYRREERDTCRDAHRGTADGTQRFWPQRPRHMPACMSFLTARWCTRAFVFHCKPGRRFLSVAAWKKHTAERHHEGDTSEGCARFRHVFLVCCVNAVGAVEVSISEYEDRISTR